MFRDLMKSLFETERSNESVRLRLRMSVVDGFKALDVNGNGQIAMHEIREVMDAAGYAIRDIDLTGLMKRLDKDRDGRVSYAEFAQELRPHL
jgi:Ca2+-binding EF-hand superfamily protein